MNKNIVAAIVSMALLAALAPEASADVVFEEITSQSGMPMGGGAGGKTKVLISGDKYRAQKKMSMDAGAMADQMKFQQQMGGINQGAMNKVNRAGMPDYPDHIMTLDEWAEFEPNAQLIDEVSKANGGKGGALKQLGKEFSGMGKNINKNLGGIFGKGKKEEPKKTAADILGKYCNEFDAGIMAKKQDEAAAKQAKEGGMGMLSIAEVVDYDTWLRTKIIRDNCPGGEDMDEQTRNLEAGGFGGGGARKTPAGIGEMQKISDDKTSEYAELKRKYEMKSEYKAEYAKAKEKGKKLAGATGDMMKDNMKAMAESMGDMMLSVQIVRLDSDKVIELFPPKNSKDPKPEDVTYKEEPLKKLKEKIDDMNEKKAKAMKANEGKMKEAEAKMAAARAKYGDKFPGGGKPEAKNLGNETVNGIPCEHWQVSERSSVDDYWVSNKFKGYEEIMAFETKLKERIGAGRAGLSFGGGGGMPDMGAMMGGVNPDKDAEIAKIKARGIVIKHVNTMKNAAPTQSAMLQNQQAVSGDIGDAGAAQKMQAMQAMKGMSPAQQAAMMRDPAAMQKMMGGAQMGAAAQESVEKRQKDGSMNFTDKQDMTSTTELRILSTDPVPAAAFEPPAGAKKK